MTGVTVDTLFARLIECEDANSAAEIEQSIWRIWVHSDDDDVAEWMARGMHASNIGDFQAMEFSRDGTALYISATDREQVIEIRGTLTKWWQR